MFEIDKEKFGVFVAELRKEKGYTQKELAAKLFISDKAISKWETAVSIPDVAMLIPLAEALDVTVTELLKCQRLESENDLDSHEVENIVKKAVNYSNDFQTQAKAQSSKGAAMLVCCAMAALVEVILLRILVHGFAEISTALITTEVITFVSAAYFQLFAKDNLPYYYDEDRIDFYSHGAFRMNISGVSFNNSNWPHIRKAAATSTSLMMVWLPVLYSIIMKLFPADLQVFRRLLLLITFFCGLFLPIYIVGKKYE